MKISLDSVKYICWITIFVEIHFIFCYDHQYVGCFGDGFAPNRVLAYFELNDPMSMTNEFCADHCCLSDNNSTYMGTELGSFCFCGYHTDSSSFYPPVGPNICNYQCPQNASQICGGLLTISIYKIDCSSNETITETQDTTVLTTTEMQETPVLTTTEMQETTVLTTTEMQDTTVLTTTEMQDTTVLTTTEMKSSTFLPTTDLLPDGACIELCPCQSVNTYHILSSEELQIKIKELKNRIAVDKKNTNSYKNTKRSLPDSRPSSRNLGIVGVILLIIPLVLMLANDCTRILEHFNLTKKT